MFSIGTKVRFVNHSGPTLTASLSADRRRIKTAPAPLSPFAAVRSPVRSPPSGIGSAPPASPRARCFVGLAKATRCCPIGSERRALPSS
jgi:hypothetical protein